MILPVVVAIASLIEPMLFGAAMGAAISGGGAVVSNTISDYHEHGEFHMQMVAENVVEAAPAAAEGAATGALFSGGLHIVGSVIGPVGSAVKSGASRVAPGLVDDIGRVATNVSDEVGRVASSAADDVGTTLGRVRDGIGKGVASARDGITNAADDVGSTLGRIGDNIGKGVTHVRAGVSNVADDVGNTLGRVGDDIGQGMANVRAGVSNVADDVGNTLGRAGDDIGQGVANVRAGVGSVFNYMRNLANARFFERLPITLPKQGYVYVIDDAAQGSTKIGITGNLPQRMKQLKSIVGRELDYVCIIPTATARVLEASLHSEFAGQRLPNTGAGTEWFKLSPAQIRQACSH